MLHRVVEFIQPYAASLGGPGLLVLAFLDSSFLTFPEVPDFLLVWLVIQHPLRWPLYVALATIGSVLGCFALYAVAKKGGDAMLRRFHAGMLERALAVIRRYGIFAVIVPSLLPPPAPFKIFVILAGVSGIPTRRFLIAIVIGRGFRYLAEGWLAFRYGERAVGYIQENMAQVSLWAAGAILVGGLAFLLWRRQRRRPRPAAG
jgi:membrane protein YqaA with SNARE-associated domain